MDHATAVAIAKAYKPNLLIDDQHDHIPNALVLRRKPEGVPFSIHVPNSLPKHAVDEAALEAYNQSVREGHPGIKPPALRQQTPEEIAADEEAALKLSLDAADKFLPT